MGEKDGLQKNRKGLRCVCGGLAFLVLTLTCGYLLTGRHFIIYKGGIAITPKQSLSFQGTFVDVRGWHLEDYQQQPELRVSLEKSGITSPIRFALLSSIDPEMRQAFTPLSFPVDAWWLQSHYVVLTAHGIVVVPRKYIIPSSSQKDAFVDIRFWKSDDFKRNTSLLESLKVSGYRDLLFEMKVEAASESLDEMNKSIERFTDDLAREMQAKWKEVFGDE